MKPLLPTLVLLCALGLALRLAPSTVADTGSADLSHVKALYGEKCSACHNLPDPQSENMNRAQWQRTVTRMLVKYKASDEISPVEAGQIVDYLSTFAPKPAVQNGRPGQAPAAQWASDAGDVWPASPTRVRVQNFEAGLGALASLMQWAGGTTGPPALWRVVGDPVAPDGLYAKVNPVGANPSRFALLVDPKMQGRDLDVRVRFQVVGGKASPAVGIVFGVSDAKTYYLLRCGAAHGTLSLLKVADTVHTALQTTPIVLTPAGGVQAVALTNSAGTPPGTKLGSGWHTLRLMARNGYIRGWIDMQKRIAFHDDSYMGGQVGLWTQGDTIATFDTWTADIYDTP